MEDRSHPALELESAIEQLELDGEERMRLERILGKRMRLWVRNVYANDRLERRLGHQKSACD